METWGINNKGDKVFLGGLENWTLASKTARDCDSFFPDDDDEQVSNEPVSCYNCKYRRWGAESFTCMKPF